MPPRASEHGSSAQSTLKRTGKGDESSLLTPFTDIIFSHFLIFVLSKAQPPSFLRNSRFARRSNNGWERMLVKVSLKLNF